MSEQQDQPTASAQKVKQILLNELEKQEQVIAQLSDEELESVSGGISMNLGGLFSRLGHAKSADAATGTKKFVEVTGGAKVAATFGMAMSTAAFIPPSGG